MLISIYFWQKAYYPCLFLQNYPPMSLDLSSPTQEFYCLCMSKKNNLSFNNLYCQTSTFRLYNTEKPSGQFLGLIVMSH
jgi:hypothetical protein